MAIQQIKTAAVYFILLISTLQLGAVNPAGNDEIPKVVSALETAVKERDLDKLRAYVAPDFSVSVATMPGALRYIEPIFQQSPETDSIRIISIETENTPREKGTNVKAAFYLKGKKPEISNIVFDENNKIRYIDYFDRLYGMFRDKPSQLRAVVPFEYEDNAIILRLKLNDSTRPLRFLFDTGADGMAISRHLADSLELVVSREQSTSIVGINRNVSISSGNTVRFDSLSLPQQNIAIFEDMGRADGIIGLNLAKAFIVKVDFEKSQLFLYDLGDYVPAPEETTVRITVPDGLIRIPGELDLLGKGAITSNFIFDTGAGFHVVAFSPFVRKNRLLLGGFKYESQNSMVSLGHATQVYHGKASRFSFGGLYFDNLPIALQASSGDGSWDPGAAGSIGIQLIKNYNFTINLVKKEVYLEEYEKK